MKEMLPALKAHRWHVVVPGLGVLAAISLLANGAFVPIPGVNEGVPLPLLMGLASVAVALIPLYPVVPELDRTLMREPVVHLLRVVSVAVLALAATLPGAITSGDARRSADPELLVVLIAIGLVATTLVGEYSWLAVMGGGLGALIAGTAQDSPLIAGLHALGLEGAVAVVAASVLVVGRAGVRRLSL